MLSNQIMMLVTFYSDVNDKFDATEGFLSGDIINGIGKLWRCLVQLYNCMIIV